MTLHHKITHYSWQFTKAPKTPEQSKNTEKISYFPKRSEKSLLELHLVFLMIFFFLMKEAFTGQEGKLPE